MKIKDYKKSELWRISYVILMLFAFFFGSCDDGREIGIVPGSGGAPFNSALPIRINSIYPNEGSAGQRVLIEGENFGNDPSKIEVYIGGKKAPVVNVKDNCMYCLVPSKAFNGDLKVQVKDEENTYISEETDIKFDYHRLKIVSTMLGKKDQYGKFEVKDGPFDDCGGLRNTCWMAWDPDPEYSDLLYLSEDADGDDGGDGKIRCIDFKTKRLYTMLNAGDIGSGGRRPRSIGFFTDKNGKAHMCVAIDQGNADDNAITIFERIPDETKPCGFKWGNRKILARYKQCNTVAFHPKTGDMYFNSYEHGQFFEVKKEVIQDILDGKRDAAKPGDGVKSLFTIQDDGWECYFTMHPEGLYCIVTIVNKNYMVRSDYNGETFTSPYVVLGQPQAANEYKDGVGTRARVYSPQQGVFVKNKEYAEKEDEYDYYFCDKHNHAVRILAPSGKVSTYAGRGSASLNSNPWGNVNGDLREEARFERPKGLAYDSKNDVFYVGDSMNRSIRRIGMEEIEDTNE